MEGRSIPKFSLPGKDGMICLFLDDLKLESQERLWPLPCLRISSVSVRKEAISRTRKVTKDN